MEKYKVCPYCGIQNGPTLFECIKCETDLTGIKITDEEAERGLSATIKNNTFAADKVMVRICDCGTKNPANARKCSSCGEDVSDIMPVPDKKSEPTSFLLSSLDGTFAYKITDAETIIGRENAMSQYLQNKAFVSRAHVKITVENDELFIENLSATNFTFINNKKISEKVKLNDGDELGFGGIYKNNQRQEQAAYFLVRIGSCI